METHYIRVLFFSVELQIMNKDIIFHKVEDVAVAIVSETNNTGEEIWNAYLLNLKNETIETVLISSRGYGTIEEKQVKT